MIGFYRKKPVTIEAVRFRILGLRHNGVKIAEWCGGLLTTERTPNGSTFISIPTLEGTMQAALGDWIIKGVNGEFYPCKPDIFEKTY